MTGQRTLPLPDGDKYVGARKDHKRHSPLTITYLSGDKYVGELKGGNRNGQGTYTWSDGRKYEGEWKDGKRWNGTKNEIDGTIFGKIVNGKKIKQ